MKQYFELLFCVFIELNYRVKLLIMNTLKRIEGQGDGWL